MNNIEHKDIFELLSVDLDMPREDIRHILVSKGASGFVQYLKTRNSLVSSSELLLNSEIKDTYGKILINSDIPLNKYITSLLDKYIKDDKFETSSFMIKATEKCLNMYKAKSYEKINKVLNGYVYCNDNYCVLYDNIPGIREEFEHVLDNIMSSPRGICTLIKMFSGFDDHKDTIVNSIISSQITLGLSHLMHSKASDAARMMSAKAGIVCLMKNVKDIAGEHICESSSAEIVRGLINDDALEQAAIMHESATHDSAPVFSDKLNRTNYYLRMLVTVSLFVDLVYQNKTDAQNLEVHKSLYELSEQGYADREITMMLGKLFLPEVKAMILEKAYDIKSRCSSCPVIWSTVGDMLPVKFICMKDSCEHSGTHKTYIPKDVHIEALNTFSTSIVAGLYFTCNMLTNELQSYYKLIVREKD